MFFQYHLADCVARCSIDIGDLFVGQPFRQFMQYFQFAQCQRFKLLTRLARQLPPLHRRESSFLPAATARRASTKLAFAGGAFQNVSLCSGGNGLVDVLIAVKRRQHQDAGRAKFL